MVFEQVRNSENNTYSLSAKDLPESWLVDFDRASDDSTPLHAIELVACVDVKQTTDSGRDCQFEDDEGTVTDFDIIHGLFDLAVYEAATGNLVRTMPIRSSPLQCPQFIYTFDDETEYFEGPSAEDYETMLAPTLDPG